MNLNITYKSFTPDPRSVIVTVLSLGMHPIIDIVISTGLTFKRYTVIALKKETKIENEICFTCTKFYRNKKRYKRNLEF